MTDQEIFFAAVTTTVGAYEPPWGTERGLKWLTLDIDGYVILDEENYWHIAEILFDHVFARALWPGEDDYVGLGDKLVPAWQYHLQQLVITPSENRIKYLADHKDEWSKPV